jgi:uncharacterized protein YunC (DUF1805 family)
MTKAEYFYMNDLNSHGVQLQFVQAIPGEFEIRLLDAEKGVFICGAYRVSAVKKIINELRMGRNDEDS